MKSQIIVGAFLMIAMLSGCSTFKAQNCSENAGYEKGMNDAKMGRLMSLNQFTLICNDDEIKVAQKGYREGYEAGKNSQGSAQMNLTFENGKLGLVGAYQCSMTHRHEIFSENANTESDARNKVLNRCKKSHTSCDERTITCSKQ